MIKVIELFSGMGAPAIALKKAGINFETIGISEIDNIAAQGYALANKQVQNFGDITKIKELPPCDFLHASSPCQSFSPNGKRNGLAGESGLILDFYRLVDNYKEKNELPTFISFENVPEMKIFFPEVFEDFVKRFDDWGYNLYYDILECKNFGNPTVRKRLFAIGIRKDRDNGLFKMPKQSKISLSMEEFLYPKNKIPEKFFCRPGTEVRPPRTEKKQAGQYVGYLKIGVDLPTQSNKIYDRDDLCPCVTASGSNFWIREENTYRKLMPEELWLISGFPLELFKVFQKTFSKTRVIKMLGNSIPIGPLEAIYKNLKESFNL